jgi:replicative DNA helicase
MDKDQARETVRGYLPDYLRGKGINPRKNFNCLNPEHPDKNPSMSYDKDKQRCHCFGCGASYDLLDLIKLDYGLSSMGEAFKKAYELYNISLDDKEAKPKKKKPLPSEPKKAQGDFMKYYKEMQTRRSDPAAQDYLKSRGISDEVAGRYWLGYDAEYSTFNTDESGQNSFAKWRALIIPTGKNSYVARNMDEPQAPAKKNRYRKKGASLIFNSKALFTAEKPIFVTEGEIDALSIIEAGGEAIALGSTSNYLQLAKMMKEQPTKQPLILALDNDEEGRKTENELAEELTRLQVPFYRYNLYGAAKDANESLLWDRENFTAEVRAAERAQEAEREALEEAEREAYLKTSAAAGIQDFLGGITASANTPAISSGFAELDEILDGGFYEGLYFLGAISSLGKTTLVMQIADNMAQRGQDVLIFSLEMAKTELMAKSISRLTYLLADNKRDAKTTRGITAGSRYEKYSAKEKALINKAIATYKEYAEHIFIHEGAGDIGVQNVRDVIEKHARITGKKPFVIIDYVQLLAPYEPRGTDKQNADKTVLELKRISRDFKTPIFGISSFNRESYKGIGGGANKGRVSMTDFKESGSFEYSADVLIGLEFLSAGNKDYEEQEEKKKDPREIRLVILKNRNGEAWKKASFRYYPKFNYYEE